jgi:hypothetical protein
MMDMHMKYADGQEVRLGDRVKLGQDHGGVVTRFIDASDNYLKKGVMVEFPTYGLIHYEEPEPDLQLIERARPGR